MNALNILGLKIELESWDKVFILVIIFLFKKLQ